MPALPSPATRSRAAALAAAVGAALVLTVLTAAPALAHDELLRSDPVDGAALSAVPTQVTLTFAEPPETLGLAVLVTGPSGDATDGPPVLNGSVVTQAVRPGSPGGSYTVAWRVTSDDGHPVSGTFGFTAQGPSPSPSASGPGSAGAGTTAAPSATTSDLDPPTDAPRSALPLVVVGGVILLGVVLSVLALLGRRHDLRASGQGGPR
jgi:methionine-rich copper-binding protein CopC